MTGKKLNIKIISIQKTLFEGVADAIILPGTVGSFEVLPDHAPIISSLESGTIVIRNGKDKPVSIDVSYGLVKVKDNEVTVCAN